MATNMNSGSPTLVESSSSSSVSGHHDHDRDVEKVDEILNDGRLPPSADPRQWSNGKKWLVTLIHSLLAFTLTTGSSIISPAISLHLTAYYDVSRLMAILSLSLYVLGMSVGPLLFAPLSELYGRNRIIWPSWSLFVVMQIPSALSPNIAGHLLSRAISGIAGSPALAVAGGGLTDMFNAEDLGIPLGIFSLSAFLGPCAGPLVGGYLTEYAPGGELESWRWTMWFMLIASGLLGLNWAWFPETYAPVLKARLLPEAGIEKIPLGQKLRGTIFRPFELLVLDPIVLLLSAYMAVIYGVLYLYFGAYPAVFTIRYGLSLGSSGLAFLGIGFGVLLCIPTAGVSNKIYMQLREKRGVTYFPEGRLPMSMIAAVLAPASAFWFAWTGFKDIHWIVPILSGIPFGWSLTTLFVCFIGYLGDTHTSVAASALAAAMILRSVFAFGFPLFMPTMYENLHPEWAGTVVGFVLVLFMPVPFLFWKFGDRIRARSRFAQVPVADE